MPALGSQAAAHPPAIRVFLQSSPDSPFEFSQPFRIGRSKTCQICINDEYVSRTHAEVTFEDGHWYIRDLSSANGLYVENQRMDATIVLANGRAACRRCGRILSRRPGG